MDELIKENKRLLELLEKVLSENRRLCGLAEEVERKWCSVNEGYCHSEYYRKIAKEILDQPEIEVGNEK